MRAATADTREIALVLYGVGHNDKKKDVPFNMDTIAPPDMFSLWSADSADVDSHMQGSQGQLMYI